MLKIYIDTQSEIPFYQQIETQVKHLVKDQQLKAGEQIPAVREMAKWLQVNPSTVAKAYYDLKMDGVVATSRRRGTIILGNEPELIGSVVSGQKSVNQDNLEPGEGPDQRTPGEGVASIFTLHLAHWWVQRSTQ
jgi:DNA-binding transcriptional regulator YhcF (GntR family)